jgi:hypothetical protein
MAIRRQPAIPASSVDTSLDSPDDLWSSADAPVVDNAAYRAGPRSVVVLAARRGSAGHEEAAAG